MRKHIVLIGIASIFLLIAAGCAGSGTQGAGPASDANPAPTQSADDDHADEAGHDEEDGEHESDHVEGVVEVEMSEFAFSPEEYTVAAGETITFMFHNAGKIDHEAVIGTMKMQREHEKAMAEAMEEESHDDGHDHEHEDAAGDDHGTGHHGDVAGVTVKPGKMKSLEYTFEEAGEIYIGCHLPGHWDGGMRARVTVEA